MIILLSHKNLGPSQEASASRLCPRAGCGISFGSPGVPASNKIVESALYFLPLGIRVRKRGPGGWSTGNPIPASEAACSKRATTTCGALPINDGEGLGTSLITLVQLPCHSWQRGVLGFTSFSTETSATCRR